MPRTDGQEESLLGLAKRWLKLQVGLHGDPRRALRERQEAESIETRMEDKVREDVGRAVVSTLLPPSWKRKFGEWEQAAEDRRVEGERRRRAEHEARPRADIRLVLRGDVQGTFDGQVPVTIGWPTPATEPDEEPDVTLTVELEPLDPVEIGGHAFHRLRFAVPEHRGPGRYDLSTLGDDLDSWDPLGFELQLDSTDEPFYWSPDYGPASVDIAPDERTLRVVMPMANAAGTRAEVEATGTLPEASAAGGS